MTGFCPVILDIKSIKVQMIKITKGLDTLMVH